MNDKLFKAREQIIKSLVNSYRLIIIVTLGIMLIPAVAVDGDIKITGKVQTGKDIKDWFE